MLLAFCLVQIPHEHFHQMLYEKFVSCENCVLFTYCLGWFTCVVTLWLSVGVVMGKCIPAYNPKYCIYQSFGREKTTGPFSA